jgi:hypothetical protein
MDRALPALIAIVSATAAFSACSSSDAAHRPTSDAGPPDIVDAGAPIDAAPVDAADAAVDCATDVQLDGLPKHLACTDFSTADKKAFTPGFVFWSDGAEKQRWVVFPPGGKIDITSFDEWKLPVGIELWKEFAIDGKKIETRLYKKLPAGWKHTTYRWNDAQTEAVRKDSGDTVALPGRTPFEVPSSSQCDYCHAAHEEPVLGFDAVSLGVPTAQGVTLATLAAEDRFSAAPPATSLTVPDDTTGKAAAANGWMHANCGSCHVDRLGAGGYGSSFRMRLKASQLLTATSATELPSYTTGYCKDSERVDPVSGQFYKYLNGGASAATTSIASVLAHARATPGQESVLNQMPPLVTHQPDTAGVASLDAWITALAVCPP